MKMPFRQPLCCAALLMGMTAAFAVPVPSALTINAAVSLDTINSELPFGAATQSATIGVVSAGASSSASFVDDPATAAPADSVAGALTETGDSVSADAQMSGAHDGVDDALTPLLGIDIVLDMVNASLAETFEVFFRVDFTHTASAAGTDAYVWSLLSVMDDALNEVFFTDHTRDTVNGDAILDDVDNLFSVVLAPGASASFSAMLTQEGGAFGDDTGSYGARLAAAIVLDRVVSSGVPPTPVPLPGSLPLLALGLALLAASRRRASA